MLTAYDLDKQVYIETNISDYMIRVVLSQLDDKGKYQPVVYFSRQITTLELNYNIYNKELLAIIKVYQE